MLSNRMDLSQDVKYIMNKLKQSDQSPSRSERIRKFGRVASSLSFSKSEGWIENIPNFLGLKDSNSNSHND